MELLIVIMFMENYRRLEGRQIELELVKLQGQNMKWIICDNTMETPYIFDIDNELPSTFCDFFKEYDHDGYESYLQKYYKPDNRTLKSKNMIGIEIIRVIKILLPLYNTMVWRPHI